MRWLHCLFLLLLSAAGLAQGTSINLYVGRDIAPSSKIRLQINTKNVPRIDVSAYRLDAVRWLSRPSLHRKRPTTSANSFRQWSLSVAASNQRPNRAPSDTYYSRQVNLPALPPGVYLLVAKGGGAEAWSVVNVTHLAVIVKRSPKRMLTWVTDALTGKVINGAKVRMFDPQGKEVAGGTTGADGVSMIEIGPGSENVVVSRGNDHAGLPSIGQNLDGRLQVHFQTDRPIYRPGQKVYFKALLRRTLGQGYQAVTNEPVVVEVRDPRDVPLDRLSLRSNDMGSVAGEVDIPQEGATGAYSLVLTVGKENAYQTFTVSEYRKPEYKVEVAPEQKRYLAGENLRFVVQADYYFGAAVPQAEVRYVIRRSRLGFGFYSAADEWFYSGDGNYYPRDSYYGDEVVADGVAHTDNTGRVVIEAPTAADWPDATYSIAVTVTDGSRRQVTGSSSVPVYAAALRIGLRSNLVFAPAGGLIPVQVHVVDLDGSPKPAQVTLRLKTFVWDKKKEDWVEKLLDSTKVNVPSTGVVTVNLPAKVAGDLTIEAFAPDGTGRTARGEMDFYVAGPFTDPQEEESYPTLDIKLDQRVYQPGAKVNAVVTTNRPKRPMLLVLEGQDIYAYKVQHAQTGSVLWTVNTNLTMSPNAYVTAAEWVDGRLISGSATVPLPDPARALSVTISSDAPKYRPGDAATYTVTTKDHRGQPVAADVALSVVDEAIYALMSDSTRDPYATFWGLRPNRVSMYSAAPEELSGGAYQQVSEVAPVRQRFEDTAYWNAFVRTGSDGTARVTFEMPGNLTTWRATGRAFTLDTAAGSARHSVLATRPVTLRLATPRQMVVGDELVLISTVNNRSDQAHEFEVKLEVNGVELSGPGTQRIRVDARSEGTLEWPIRLAAFRPAPATLTAQVVALDDPAAVQKDLADALRMSVPIAPHGVEERFAESMPVEASASQQLLLPADILPDAGRFTVRVWLGLGPVAESSAQAVLSSGRYGTLIAAQQLEIATLKELPAEDKAIRESLAMLSRTMNYYGWGWWEGAPADPQVTAYVLYSLATAMQHGVPVPEVLIRSARSSAQQQFNSTNLWEHRALLAASMLLSEPKLGMQMATEVLQRGMNLSPFAKLRLAEGLVAVEQTGHANRLVNEVLAGVSGGATGTTVPVGFGIGWKATQVQTTAQALLTLTKMDAEPETQGKLAQWLATESSWKSTLDHTAIFRAFHAYLEKHPEPASLGPVQVTVNGVAVPTEKEKLAEAVVAIVPMSAVQPGANAIAVSRQGGGQAFMAAEARVFRPLKDENESGIRVIRRFEVRNAAGVWEELDRPVLPNEPIRCTVTVWGDSIEDAMRVVEPLPAGFEFIEDDWTTRSRQEVRDAAVIHYVIAGGNPIFFRYYMRGESEGVVTALPATAEVLRRPWVRGRSQETQIVIRKASQ